jgi:serine/threonine-protein kinase
VKPDPRIGTTLDGRYQIVDQLAAGGMGVVYRGERLGLGRSVAIKFLHAHMAADSSFLKRFAIEAKAMARLQHPHCAAVIDFGVEGEEPYVVMDLVAGESLRRVLDRGRLPAGRALGIMRQILSGLAHAHSHGITHRDIKPDNIMVEAAGSFGDQVRILDFGLAKLREGTSALTTGFVVGTPSYMAPEQTLALPVDERTDIYACGVVLFEMLTGEKPFQADEAVEVLIMHRETPPPRLAEKAPDLRFSDELEAAVRQAMAKDPGHRFASAAAFATALEHVPEAAARLSGALAAVTPSTPAPVLASAPASQVLGTEATAWASPQANAPKRDANATEHLGASDVQSVRSYVAPARPPTGEHVGSAQLRAFVAELGASQPAQPLAAVSAPAPAAPPQAHGQLPQAHGQLPQAHVPGFVPGRADTGFPGRADTGFPATRADSVQSAVSPEQSSLAPWTAAPTDVPGHPRSAFRRNRWILGSAVAGVLALVVVVAVLGRGKPEDTADEKAAAAEHAAPEGAGDEPAEADKAVELPEPVYEDPRMMSDYLHAKGYIKHGKNERARDLLERLRRYDPETAAVHYLLGKAYLGDLWVRDGLDAFRNAIALEPGYRNDPELIDSVAAGLGSDSQHAAAARFLVQEIGEPARPALERIAEGHHREDVRERALRALRQLQ